MLKSGYIVEYKKINVQGGMHHGGDENGIKLTPKVMRLCYASLSNLSLVPTTHEAIWFVDKKNPSPENLIFLYKQIKEMKKYIKKGQVDGL